MKKLLALVLALVMTLGLATVGTSAAFSDADSIEYKEAVDVMSALGVIAGMDDGSFNPKGTLTREQGAKIISYMLMGGKETGDALTASSAPFSDVAADRWSAGAIQYCANAGILAGVGGGKFNPTGELTGVAFAKMLLTALGYDADREGLTGSDWQINVAKLINATDILDGMGALKYVGAITRDEAAKMAFNTLTEEMVDYQGNGLSTDGKGNLANTRRYLPNTNYDFSTNGNTANGDALMQFVENYFPYVKYYSGSDAFGTPVDYWYTGASRTDYQFNPFVDADKAKCVVADVSGTGILATYTDKVADVEINDLYNLLNLSAAQDVPVYENGSQNGYIYVSKGDDTSAFADREVPNHNNTATAGDDANVARFYAGATVTVVDSDNDSTHTDAHIVVKYPLLAKVTKVTAASGGKDRFVTLTVYAKNNIVANVTTANGAAWATAAANTITGVEYTTEDFAKDDYVLVYLKNTSIVTATGYTNTAANRTTIGNAIGEAELVKPVTGKITAVAGNNVAGNVSNTFGNRATALTVDGTKYSISPALYTALATSTTNPAWDDAYSLNSNYDLYLSNGYVIGVEGSGSYAANDLDDLVFVTRNAYQVTDTVGTNYYVELVTLDGQIERVIDKTAGGNDVDGNAIARGFYLREADGSKYKFTRVLVGNNAGTTNTMFTTDATQAAYNEAGYASLVTTALNNGGKLSMKTDTATITVSTTSIRTNAAADSTATKAHITDDTTILFVDGTGSDLKASAAKGAIRQTIADGSLVVASVDKDNNLLASVILVATKQVNSTGDVVFVIGSAKGTVRIGNTNRSTYNMYDIATGEKTEVPAKSAPQTGFATYTVDSDGVYEFTAEAFVNGDDDGQYVINSTASLFNKTKLSTAISSAALDGVDAADAYIKDIDDDTLTTLDEIADAAGVTGYAYVKDEKVVSIFVTDSTTDPTLYTLSYNLGTYTTDTTSGYNSDSGTWANVRVLDGVKVTAATAPTAAAGKQFIGWLNSVDNKLYAPGDDVAVGAATTLRALYVTTALGASLTKVAAGGDWSTMFNGLTVTVSNQPGTPVDISSLVEAAITKVGTATSNLGTTTLTVGNSTGNLTLTGTANHDAVVTDGLAIEVTLTVTYEDGETAPFVLTGTSAS